MITILDNEFIEWIKPNVKSLYGSHKNMGLPTFRTANNSHHGKRVPDYIFKTLNERWGCIEYEPGETYGEITKGALQLNDIFYLLSNGLKFMIDNISIKPNLFLLATKHSKKGYLWKNDTRIVETSGYDENNPIKTQNTTVWHSTRWMWRFCGRKQEELSESNPIGVKHFSVIYANEYSNKPEIELGGNSKHLLCNL